MENEIKQEPIKILVIIDAQKDFITGSLSNLNAQKVVPKIVEKINNFDGNYIVYTMDTHNANYLNTLEGKKLPVEHCIYGTPGWKLDPYIREAIKKKEQSGVTIYQVLKNAFGSSRVPYDEEHKDWTSLPIVLRTIQVVETHDIEEDFSKLYIEMCGFCTDICVISNALILKAETYNNVEITVDSKCCAGVTPEKHEAALEVMRSCQINVI